MRVSKVGVSSQGLKLSASTLLRFGWWTIVENSEVVEDELRGGGLR